MSVESARPLSIGDGKRWCFMNGAWSDGPDGELAPPDGSGEPQIAVLHETEYSDLDATFRFRFPWTFGGARLVFRLLDATRYYALDIPWGGQQNRNRPFWAGIVVADGTPLQRYLHLGLVPGVWPERDGWYCGRVQSSGQHIRAWVEGRLVADVQDRTFVRGRIGLMGEATAGIGTPRFTDFQVSGTKMSPPSAWAGLRAPAPHWITPCRQTDPQTYQAYPSMIRTKSGELVLNVPFVNPNGGEPLRRRVWVRSRDGGRTWSEPEPSTARQAFGGSFVRRDGTWVCIHSQDYPDPPPEQDTTPEQTFWSIESSDEGKTWTEPEPLSVVGKWPEEFGARPSLGGQVLRLQDGTLLVPVYCQVHHKKPSSYFEGTIFSSFVFRSTDDGRTWSAPVRCDRDNSPDRPRWFCPANCSEVSLAECEGNVVLGFARPGPWPFMWQLLSLDGGKSWEPGSYGAFPGYCITLTRTASGALVAVHRFPYLTANVSYDGGKNWDVGTIIDYPQWANHQAVEVEPDVVLVVYMGHIIERGQADMRAVRLRVTGEGLKLAD